MCNTAHEMGDRRDELLNGRIFAMSPRPTVNHNIVSLNIARIFAYFLKGKACMAFSDGVDLFLSPADRFVPDGMIVCNRDIIKTNGIHGAPDLVIEVLSPNTAKNDRGYKKDAYEKAGVKEYWIVDTESKSIEVHLLKDGAYILDNIYYVYPDYLIEMMNDKEKAEIMKEFHCSLYPDLSILVEDVFEGMIEA